MARCLKCTNTSAIVTDPRRPRNVLPLVNKSLAIFQWKQDIGAAENLCKEALAIDSDCDVAVATLAQLSLQQGKIDEAIKYFEKSGKLARTEAELVNAITCELDLPSLGVAVGKRGAGVAGGYRARRIR